MTFADVASNGSMLDKSDSSFPSESFTNDALNLENTADRLVTTVKAKLNCTFTGRG